MQPASTLPTQDLCALYLHTPHERPWLVTPAMMKGNKVLYSTKMTILNLFFMKYFLQFERFLLFPRWILILWWHGTPYSNNPPFVINLCIVRSVPATSGASGQGDS